MIDPLKNAISGRAVWLCLFSSVIAGTLYAMAKVARSGFPLASYLFLFSVPAVIVGWWLRRRLGRVGIYASMLVGHLGAVMLLSANRGRFALYALLALVIPATVFLFLRRPGATRAMGPALAASIVVGVFSAALVGDLLYSARKSKFLYNGQPHVGRMMGIDTRPMSPVFPQERHTFPSAWTTTTGHTIRYPSILYRQPFVFSPVEPSEEAVLFAMNNSDAFKTEALLNPSFEHWTRRRAHENRDAEDLPDSFTYEQSGQGGGVKKNLEVKFVHDGRVSAALYPSSTGNSMLRQDVEGFSKLRGRFVQFSVWVKSANTAAKAIQIDVQTHDQKVSVSSYENTGGWENLHVAAFLPDSARGVIVTMNVKQRATAPAFFDGATLEVSAIDYLREAIGFEVALGSRRSSSLMLKRHYVELIHANVPARIKSALFAVGQPMVRLLEGVVEIDGGDMENAFRRLGGRGEAAVQRVAIVEQGMGRAVEQRGARLLTEDSLQAVTDGPCKRGLLRVEAYTYDRAEFIVQSEAACVLYWSDAYDRRWRAFVNGHRSPVFRANVNFKAVVVPAGRSNVHFEYVPALFEAGLRIYYASLAASIIGALVSRVWMARRKKGPGAAGAAASL